MCVPPCLSLTGPHHPAFPPMVVADMLLLFFPCSFAGTTLSPSTSSNCQDASAEEEGEFEEEGGEEY